MKLRTSNKVMKLRDYQLDIVDRTIKAIGSTLIQAPTGSGKTLIAKTITQQHSDSSKKSLFLAPKLNLLQQTYEAFKELNPQVIHGSKSFDTNANAFVSTIQTMSRRVELIQSMDFDYIFFDEYHYGSDGKMQQVIKDAHNGHMVGLSATPYDTDGKLLTDGFDNIIDDYDAKYMVNNKYLTPIIPFKIHNPDLTKIKRVAGDYDKKELDVRLNNPSEILTVVSLTKDVMVKRKKCITFCINISHAEMMTAIYNENGVTSKYLHSKMKREEQENIIQEFKDDVFKNLVSVDMITTGFDVPSVDTIVLSRPTQSQNLYKQMIGRGMRLSEGKTDCHLLDCGGVITRLGMPLDPIVYMSKGKSNKAPYKCSECDTSIPRKTTIVNHKEPISKCPVCKDEKIWDTDTLTSCNSCNRLYSYSDNKEFYTFTADTITLNCMCGEDTTTGIDDDYGDIDILSMMVLTDKQTDIVIDNFMNQCSNTDEVFIENGREYIKSRDSVMYFVDYSVEAEEMLSHKSKKIAELYTDREEKYITNNLVKKIRTDIVSKSGDMEVFDNLKIPRLLNQYVWIHNNYEFRYPQCYSEFVECEKQMDINIETTNLTAKTFAKHLKLNHTDKWKEYKMLAKIGKMRDKYVEYVFNEIGMKKQTIKNSFRTRSENIKRQEGRPITEAELKSFAEYLVKN